MVMVVVMVVMIVVIEVDGGSASGKSVKKSTNIKELSWSPKASKVRKIYKSHWFGETFTKVPIFCQLDTKNLSSYQNFLTVSQPLFAEPKCSLDTIFESITNKAKRVELLMLCHVYPP